MANSMSLHDPNDNLLGTYLRDRRAKLDPVALGFPLTRRRTPGLRREEVAQRANVSATWYTWLEQGRGGAPSADVLDRIARALMLTDIEREHLFLIGLGRPPEVHYQAAEGVTPRLQRVLDSLQLSPAIVKTSTGTSSPGIAPRPRCWPTMQNFRPGSATFCVLFSAMLTCAPRSLIGKALRDSR
jgi:transcriptional regulator with XRE-family HTH domain